ncbi:nicotinate phosphoribosyltransferase [soil metagenome]
MRGPAGHEVVPEAALFTDLYELTMAASYHGHGLDHRATFEVFVRSLPPTRNFLVACGLELALSHLERLSFSTEALAYLEALGLFRRSFLDHLGGLRFTGDVRAVPEGEVVFGNQPLLELTAPLIEAQLVETFLVNCLSSHTMVASKAARVALASGGRSFVDFSARRDHGVDAALHAARAAVIAGASATSLVEAGRRFGLRLSGTMAHAYVMSHADEREAFRAYARDYPRDAVLLIDTYDTLQGARRAAEVARELSAEGISVRGVRLDSGDVDALAIEVRRILDDAGCPDVQILVSGDLDEHRVAELLAAGAPVDAFGVGTRMGTSDDAPSLGTVYKLVEDETGPKMKLSEGKGSLPGRKQVFRFCENDRYDYDVLGLVDEAFAGGRPLLEPVMVGGRRLAPAPPVADLAERCRAALDALPPTLRRLGPAPPYPVRLSEGLTSLVADMTADLTVEPGVERSVRGVQ